MEVFDLEKINCNKITTFFRKNNYYFKYNKDSLKFQLSDICVYSIENNKYTNKLHFKFRIGSNYINKIIELEDHIYGKLNIKPIDYKSIINNQIIDSKVIERYKKFEIDVFDSEENLTTLSQISNGDMVDAEFELKNIWKLTLDSNIKYGIIVILRKIALRSNK